MAFYVTDGKYKQKTDPPKPKRVGNNTKCNEGKAKLILDLESMVSKLNKEKAERILDQELCTKLTEESEKLILDQAAKLLFQTENGKKLDDTNKRIEELENEFNRFSQQTNEKIKEVKGDIQKAATSFSDFSFKQQSTHKLSEKDVADMENGRISKEHGGGS